MSARAPRPLTPRRRWLYETIFESDTRMGRIFDVVLLGLGYGAIAVPAGTITAELGRASRPSSGQHQ